MLNFKSGFVSIIGRPNAGKSTLINALVGEKIAIISDKPQTTRTNALGILNEDDMQIVFTDTPGVHVPKTKLGEYMMKSANEAMRDVDAIILVVEPLASIGRTEEKILSEIKKSHIPVILVINKVDTIVNKEEILSVILAYTKEYEFSAVVPLSARKNDGVSLLKEELLKLIPEGPKYYPDDYITDQPERQIVAEIIREKLLHTLDKEVPHGIAIEIYKMKEKENVVQISANIFCEKASHKGIIIGKNGEMLKSVGRRAREDAEKMLGKKVYLELWVKVQSDWRNKNSVIKELGYEF